MRTITIDEICRIPHTNFLDLVENGLRVETPNSSGVGFQVWPWTHPDSLGTPVPVENFLGQPGYWLADQARLTIVSNGEVVAKVVATTSPRKKQDYPVRYVRSKALRPLFSARRLPELLKTGPITLVKYIEPIADICGHRAEEATPISIGLARDGLSTICDRVENGEYFNVHAKKPSRYSTNDISECLFICSIGPTRVTGINSESIPLDPSEHSVTYPIKYRTYSGERWRENGAQIRSIRECLGWKSFKMARRLGISPSTLSNHENGHRNNEGTLKKARELAEKEGS